VRAVRYVFLAQSTRELNARRYLNMHATVGQHLPFQLHSPFLKPSEYIIHPNETSIRGGGLEVACSRNVDSIFGITKVWLRGNVDPQSRRTQSVLVPRQRDRVSDRTNLRFAVKAVSKSAFHTNIRVFWQVNIWPKQLHQRDLNNYINVKTNTNQHSNMISRALLHLCAAVSPGSANNTYTERIQCWQTT